jgi:hypothetical protein
MSLCMVIGGIVACINAFGSVAGSGFEGPLIRKRT